MPGLVESSLFSPLSHTCDTGHVKNWSTIIYHSGSKSQQNYIKSRR